MLVACTNTYTYTHLKILLYINVYTLLLYKELTYHACKTSLKGMHHTKPIAFREILSIVKRILNPNICCSINIKKSICNRGYFLRFKIIIMVTSNLVRVRLCLSLTLVSIKLSEFMIKLNNPKN